MLHSELQAFHAKGKEGWHHLHDQIKSAAAKAEDARAAHLKTVAEEAAQQSKHEAAVAVEVQEHIESDTQHKLEEEQKALAQVRALSKA